MTGDEIDLLVKLKIRAQCEQTFVLGSHWRLNLPESQPMLIADVSYESVRLFDANGNSLWLAHTTALACLVAAEVS